MVVNVAVNNSIKGRILDGSVLSIRQERHRSYPVPLSLKNHDKWMRTTEYDILTRGRLPLGWSCFQNQGDSSFHQHSTAICELAASEDRWIEWTLLYTVVSKGGQYDCPKGS